MAYEQIGEFSKAIAEFERGGIKGAYLGHAYAVAGMADEARKDRIEQLIFLNVDPVITMKDFGTQYTNQNTYDGIIFSENIITQGVTAVKKVILVLRVLAIGCAVEWLLLALFTEE